MFYLLYRSEAVRPFSAAEVQALCRNSAPRNRRIGVRGFLVHFDGVFLQLLEGEEYRVRRLFGVIRRDRRHHSATVLLEEDDENAFGLCRWLPVAGRMLAPEDFDGFACGVATTPGHFHEQSQDPDFALSIVTRSYILSRMHEELGRMETA